jgi:hypothetical protein
MVREVLPSFNLKFRLLLSIIILPEQKSLHADDRSQHPTSSSKTKICAMSWDPNRHSQASDHRSDAQDKEQGSKSVELGLDHYGLRRQYGALVGFEDQLVDELRVRTVPNCCRTTEGLRERYRGFGVFDCNLIW